MPDYPFPASPPDGAYSDNAHAARVRATTILSVRRGNHVVIAGDGQVSLGQTIMKASARKVRRMNEGAAVAGFAGSAADGIALFERLDGKLRGHGGNLRRAVVEMAKDWRTDRVLRRLEAMLIIADREQTYLVSGTGDVIEPDDGVVSIGSGGPYALAAARALIAKTELGVRDIAETAMGIAADICVYTNHKLVIEELT
ncbi:ATP-dependent protease subunit HslV [Haliangium ochraceum]|uniref:ATP-dependent protease subunit HslV n=1 Tax=Haliangium ochraceum TaxID=80816 RepID=UPI00019BA66B